MRIIEIVNLLYEVPRDLPVCVKRLCMHPYGNKSQQAVQIPTVVVPKCRLRQSSPIGVLYCHAHYSNCTTTIRDATGSPNLCIKVARASVRQYKSTSCTAHYNGCTKTHLRQCCPLVVVYCHNHHRNCTPTVQAVTVLPSLCRKTVAPVRRRKSESCIHPYSRCTKMRLVPECSDLFGFLPYALVASYTYFMRCHGTNVVQAPVRQCKSATCIDP